MKYEVQNAKGVKSVKEATGSRADEFIIEPKFDGFRLHAEVGLNGSVRFFTRNGKEHTGKLPWVAEELAGTYDPGTVLDGEIVGSYMEDGRVVNDFEFVQSVMLSGVDEAIRKQRESRPLGMMIFDMLQDSGQDIRQHSLGQRRDAFVGYLRRSGAHKFIVHAHWVEASEEMYEHFVDLGYEGVVIKDTKAPYASGKRGKGWFKLKAQPTIDCIVLGEGKPGEGKFKGMVGSVRFGQIVATPPADKGIEFEWVEIGGKKYTVQERGQASGFDDEERAWITEQLRQGTTGLVIEVAHMGVMAGKSGKVRHPQFKRFRTDKPATECMWADK